MSPGGEFVQASAALVSVAAAQETPPDGPALVPRGTCVPGSPGTVTVTIGEVVHGELSRQGTAWVAD